MTTIAQSAAPAGPAKPAISFFERYLTLWVFLCIVVGIALGQALPGPVQAVGRLEFANVNLPVGLLIWVMIIPMLLRVDFGALREVGQHWRGIGVTLFINWAVKPFSMALLAWLFIRHVFAPYLPAEQLDSYVAGLILLAAAPCTAMVFVWSRLTNGHPLFTLSQVALNKARAARIRPPPPSPRPLPPPRTPAANRRPPAKPAARYSPAAGSPRYRREYRRPARA